MPKPALKQIGAGVYAWIGANGDSNAGAVTTPDALWAIDAQQTPALGRAFRQAVEHESGRPVAGLINTHFHLDHTAGNIAFADVPIRAQHKTLQSIETYLGPARGNRWSISDSDDKLRLFFGSNVRELVPPGDPLEQWFANRLSAAEYATIDLIGPSETFGDHMVFERPDGALCADYWGPAHCDGDLILHIARQKIAFLGDLLFVGRFPWLGDCDLDGWIARLDRVLSLELETVVPGHGDVCSPREVASFRDLLVALRAAVQRAVASGMSEAAAVREVALPPYAAMPRYREWLPPNVRAVYRYLRSRQG
jgi:glyoxylase-like metal-dependent hydrolase (beta-lactamase superfamily II)